MKTNCCKSEQLLELENEILCLNSSCKNYMGVCHPYKAQKLLKNFVALSIFSFYFFLSVDDFSMGHKRKEEIHLNSEEATLSPLTEKNLELELLNKGIICPKEVMAQIKLESGNLRSFLLKKTNNMLGMRFPFSRDSKAIGLYLPASDTIIYGTREELKKYRSANQYAVFGSWQDAIEDYKMWQVANFKLAEKYLNFLGNVYAEDTAYVSKIRRVAALTN